MKCLKSHVCGVPGCEHHGEHKETDGCHEICGAYDVKCIDSKGDMKMVRIYLAGPYSSDKLLKSMDNVRIALLMTVKLIRAGFAVYCSWTDFLYHLVLGPGETLTVDHYYHNSMQWLLVSDAVLLLPGWRDSKGALKEVEVALMKNIAVYETFDDLMAVYKGTATTPGNPDSYKEAEPS